jgi:hypothetical protein
MYKINPQSNSIEQLTQKSFTELGFRERTHLQEWIAKEPSCLGQELLIIQKEFDGFDDTRERLDLLALDKDGALVIIENKLDDTGRDVIWQAIKYASYCSSLTTNQIINIYQDYLNKYENGNDARERLSDFFNGCDYDEISLNGISQDQRIIFVAANFRKEITSAALWLISHNIQIQCFKAIPYSLGEDLFLKIDQIIPTKEAEEFMIGMAEKALEEKSTEKTMKNRHIIRLEFWKRLLEEMTKSNCTLFSGISPSKEHWLSAGSGMRGVPFSFVFSKGYARVEIYIDRGDKEENEYIFDTLYAQKNDIEAQFENPLAWEKLESKRACRIKYEHPFDGYDRDNWEEMIPFMRVSMEKMEASFKAPLKEINTKLKS